MYWTYGVIVFATFVFLTTITMWHFFGLALWQPIIAIMLSSPLSYLAVRFVVTSLKNTLIIVHLCSCSGETDINPVSTVGKVMQLIFAGIAPHNLVVNLMSAIVTASGASQVRCVR